MCGFEFNNLNKVSELVLNVIRVAYGYLWRITLLG